eukprot:TRINITY_DN6216_c1_g3_i2.p2 TRINITY_DN6216_c1_g3~~TRINITY_DN6216_c1_g3_i2.p2  ORF type:complete len:823 (-),score=247.52 TRINITY_DN6216_c1_g3_i2:195-2663(-)
MSSIGRKIAWPFEYLLILGALLGSNFSPTKPAPEPDPWPEPGRDFVQYLGQATVLMRLDGKHILTDPMFSKRFSFAKMVKRRTEPPLRVDELPPIDLVLLSHAHGDHLDLPSLRAIAAANPAPLTLVGAQGVAGYAKAKLAPEHKVRAIDLAWGRAVQVGPLVVSSWPGEHLGGRHWLTLDFSKYKYCGFVIQSPERAVFFPGDSGCHPAFAQLPQHFELDLALMPIDAFNRRGFLRHRHMSPEDALDIFCQSGARRMVPVHWGTFTLCNEPLGLAQQRLDGALQQNPALAAKVHKLPLGHVLPLQARAVPCDPGPERATGRREWPVRSPMPGIVPAGAGQGRFAGVLGALFHCQGQAEAEQGAGGTVVAHLHSAAVGLGDLVDHGQAQAGAAFFGGVEGGEDGLALGRRHAGPLVGHGQDQLAVARAGAQAHLAAGRRGLGRVAHQVDQGLLQALGVQHDRGQVRGCLALQAHLVLRGQGRGHLQGLLDELRQLHRAQVQLQGPGEVQHLLDHGLQAGGLLHHHLQLVGFGPLGGQLAPYLGREAADGHERGFHVMGHAGHRLAHRGQVGRPLGVGRKAFLPSAQPTHQQAHRHEQHHLGDARSDQGRAEVMHQQDKGQIQGAYDGGHPEPYPGAPPETGQQNGQEVEVLQKDVGHRLVGPQAQVQPTDDQDHGHQHRQAELGVARGKCHRPHYACSGPWGPDYCSSSAFMAWYWSRSISPRAQRSLRMVRARSGACPLGRPGVSFLEALKSHLTRATPATMSRIQKMIIKGPPSQPMPYIMWPLQPPPGPYWLAGAARYARPWVRKFMSALPGTARPGRR